VDANNNYIELDATGLTDGFWDALKLMQQTAEMRAQLETIELERWTLDFELSLGILNYPMTRYQAYKLLRWPRLYPPLRTASEAFELLKLIPEERFSTPLIKKP